MSLISAGSISLDSTFKSTCQDLDSASGNSGNEVSWLPSSTPLPFPQTLLVSPTAYIIHVVQASVSRLLLSHITVQKPSQLNNKPAGYWLQKVLRLEKLEPTSILKNTVCDDMPSTYHHKDLNFV
jgi:hypothetical protein